MSVAHRTPLAPVTVDLTPIANRVVGELGAAPCAVVAAAIRRPDGAFRLGAGAAGTLWPAPEAPSAAIDTPFDLASLTKPITAVTLARLARSGHLRLDEPLDALLPAARATPSARVPLVLFAAHRAGLDAHRGLYAPLERGEPVDAAAALREAACARRPGCEGDPPEGGFSPVYSDLGYVLLGAAIAARAGADLDEVIAREVVRPLGLSIGSARQLRARLAEEAGAVAARGPIAGAGSDFDARVAPTEVVAWRGGVVRGVVHDENAFALAGDASAGHAGLFGDALSVTRFGMAILDALDGRSPDWLAPSDVAPLVEARPGGSHLAGFDRRSGDAPTSGSRFGPRTFGHLGFTGTSLWIDPDAALVGVLLTNRVHPTRASDAIRRARPAAYDAIADAMLPLGTRRG